MPMGTPGRAPTKSGHIRDHSRSFQRGIRRKTVSMTPISATSGMAVLTSKKMASSGRESRTEPKPENPWIKLNFKKFEENLDPGKAGRKDKTERDEKK